MRMFRVRTTGEVRYGHFRDVLEVSKEIQELHKARGWTVGTVFIRSFGQANIIEIDADYPDLAALEKESKASMKDEELVKLIRRSADFFVQGTIRTELLRTVEDL